MLIEHRDAVGAAMDRPRGGFEITRQQAQQRALARAVAAADRYPLGPAHLE
jgi:hypothetical protein